MVHLRDTISYSFVSIKMKTLHVCFHDINGLIRCCWDDSSKDTSNKITKYSSPKHSLSKWLKSEEERKPHWLWSWFFCNVRKCSSGQSSPSKLFTNLIDCIEQTAVPWIWHHSIVDDLDLHVLKRNVNKGFKEPSHKSSKNFSSKRLFIKLTHHCIKNPKPYICLWNSIHQK